MACVGIDFGTTNSLVAYYNGQEIELIKFNDEYMMPTIATYGNTAIESIKRIISNPDEPYPFEHKIENGIHYLLVNTEWLSITDICANILRHMRHKTNQQLNRNIVNCILTVPARFDEYQKQIVIEAAIKAGWRVVRVIAEPTAGFIGQEEENDGIYGIYDLGGGTFDFSLVRKSDMVMQVLGTVGDTRIGMDYIDRALAQTKWMSTNDIKLARESGNISDLSACDEMISNTIDKCMQLIDHTGHMPKKIYMIGGGALNPYIVSKVGSESGIEVQVGKDPQLSVVKGAALYAGWITDSNLYLLIDVAPLCIGVESMHGMVEWVIMRNAPLPVAKKITFTNISDNQTHIYFNIVQGEGIFVKDCRVLGEFKVEIAKQKAHSVRIELTFILDTNGLLNIECQDLDTHFKYDISFNSGEGLSEDMIKRIIKQTADKLEDSEVNRKFYKICNEIDIILRNFPEELELLDKRAKLLTLEEAEMLLNEVNHQLHDQIQDNLAHAAQQIFDDIVKQV